MRSGKEVEVVIPMSIAVDSEALILILTGLIFFFAIPTAINAFHPSEETLNILLISSQITAAAGTLFLAYVTCKNVEALRIEKLRESFKAIAKELYRAKKNVETDLKDIGKMLEASKKISLGGTYVSEDIIRKDFKLYYGKGLKLFKYVDVCNSKIYEYSKKYKEISLHRDNESSNEDGKYLNDFESMAESEVKRCLEKLRDELDNVIDDIIKKYALSGQEITAEKGVV